MLRKSLKSIQRFGLTIREPVQANSEAEAEAYRHNQLVICDFVSGKVVYGVIDRDHLYDAEGNRFAY